jgi:hypothetical protein
MRTAWSSLIWKVRGGKRVGTLSAGRPHSGRSPAGSPTNSFENKSSQANGARSTPDASYAGLMPADSVCSGELRPGLKIAAQWLRFAAAQESPIGT